MVLAWPGTRHRCDCGAGGSRRWAWQRVGMSVAVTGMWLCLTSCISVESRFEFAADGTGELHLRYRLDAALAKLGVAPGSGTLPLPISEAEFQAAAALVEGLELISYRRVDHDRESEVIAMLRFDRVERLAELPSFSALNPRLEGTDPVLFELVIVDAGAEPLDENVLSLLATLLGDHTVSFVVVTPRPIRDSSAGTLAADRRQVALSMSLAEYAAMDERQLLAVRW